MTQDEWLVRRVCSGDVEAFRPLVERYQRPILRFIFSITADRHLAEDVAQEVFLATYRNIHSFDPDRSQFVTWLYTIARNRAHDGDSETKRYSAGSVARLSSTCRPSGCA